MAPVARRYGYDVVVVEREARREAGFLNRVASAVRIAAGACVAVFLAACGPEPSPASTQGSTIPVPDASVEALRTAAVRAQEAPLNESGSERLAADEWPYSFVREPFVHPTIVEDLSTWLSDVGDQVVAINLLDAQGSNRYSGSIGVTEIDGRCPYVYWRPTEERSEFGYQYVGMTESRVHVLYASSWGGGSGVFKRLMLLTITSDAGIDWNGQDVVQDDRERLLVNKLGELALGDRWDGGLRVAGNTLATGRDEGWFSVSGGAGGGGPDHERVLTIDVRRSDGLDFGAPEYTCWGTAEGQP